MELKIEDLSLEEKNWSNDNCWNRWKQNYRKNQKINIKI